MGVLRGSSKGGNILIGLFDMLLTMIRLSGVFRFNNQDAKDIFPPQMMPTAFADDFYLLTYDPDLKGVQSSADVILSFFCMMTGLEIAPS